MIIEIFPFSGLDILDMVHFNISEFLSEKYPGISFRVEDYDMDFEYSLVFEDKKRHVSEFDLNLISDLIKEWHLNCIITDEKTSLIFKYDSSEWESNEQF